MIRFFKLIFILIVFLAGMMLERYGDPQPVDRFLDRFVASKPVTVITSVFKGKVDETLEDAKSKIREMVEE